MTKSRLSPGRALLLLSLTSIFISCSNQGNTSSDDASTTTPTTTPFQFSFSNDPQDTLNQLASTRGALDQSKISTACGVQNALIVEPAGVRYFRWSDAAWVEHFDFPIAGATDAPFIITSRDYTGDGLLDYLVGFRESASYGAILSPTGPTCDWQWLTFTFPEGGSSVLVDNLNWSDESMVLTGLNKNGLNPTANLRFFFDSTKLELVGQDDPYSNPDMAWMKDACENVERLLPQIFEASKNSDANSLAGQAPTRIDYYDGPDAFQILKDWTRAMEDAISALQAVGPQNLNMTSKEIYYLGELTVPYTTSYVTGGWLMELDRVTNAHDRLAAYCDMLPPRL